ncbi:MAG: hypothetical protein L0219_20855, partial [Phycisphaerales bacterium]|nr:hypothetical protein [Phycisphaerales bacterium]
MNETKMLIGLTAVLSASSAAKAADDYNPTKPVRPSAGYINDWLRKDNPYMSAWDIGAQVRLRYEVRDNFGILGSPG